MKAVIMAGGENSFGVGGAVCGSDAAGLLRL